MEGKVLLAIFPLFSFTYHTDDTQRGVSVLRKTRLSSWAVPGQATVDTPVAPCWIGGVISLNVKLTPMAVEL